MFICGYLVIQVQQNNDRQISVNEILPELKWFLMLTSQEDLAAIKECCCQDVRTSELNM